MKRLIAALAAAALLSGCIKMDKSLPTDMPEYVKLYPGATPVTSMNVAGMEAVVYQAAARPDDVVGFYRTQASSDGLPETQQRTPNAGSADQRQATFGDPASGKFLVVVARPQGQGSIVSLTYKPTPKASS